MLENIWRITRCSHYLKNHCYIRSRLNCFSHESLQRKIEPKYIQKSDGGEGGDGWFNVYESFLNSICLCLFYLLIFLSTPPFPSFSALFLPVPPKSFHKVSSPFHLSPLFISVVPAYSYCSFHICISSPFYLSQLSFLYVPAFFSCLHSPFLLSSLFFPPVSAFLPSCLHSPLPMSPLSFTPVFTLLYWCLLSLSPSFLFSLLLSPRLIKMPVLASLTHTHYSRFRNPTVHCSPGSWPPPFPFPFLLPLYNVVCSFFIFFITESSSSWASGLKERKKSELLKPRPEKCHDYTLEYRLCSRPSLLAKLGKTANQCRCSSYEASVVRTLSRDKNSTKLQIC